MALSQPEREGYLVYVGSPMNLLCLSAPSMDVTTRDVEVACEEAGGGMKPLLVYNSFVLEVATPREMLENLSSSQLI